MADKTALIAGATGLVGKELTMILCGKPEYQTVTVLVRRSMGISHPKLQEVIVEYDQLDQYQSHFAVDDIFCCLGTTIKKAGTQEAFRRVDYVYPVKMAALGRKMGAQRFLIISSMGADAGSRIFYSRTKGEVEEAVAQAGFPSLHIFRPSLLLGKRQESRPGETAAAFTSKLLPFLFTGPLNKYRPINASTVANAMYKAAQAEVSGTIVHESDQIAAMGEER